MVSEFVPSSISQYIHRILAKGMVSDEMAIGDIAPE